MIEREEVRFITFDLAVEERGRGGWRPARELSKDQITLLVGGKKTALDLFESRCAAAPASTPEPGRESAREPTDSGTVAATADVVHYILYFEETHLSYVDGRRSLKAALEWAEATARPSDEVMIVVGGRGLRIVRPMLPVSRHLKEDIEAAIADFGSTDMWGNQETARIQEVLEVLRHTIPPDNAAALSNVYAEEAYLRARRALENMANLMSLFENVEGTKNLIFFSDKLRYIPGEVYPLSTDLLNTRAYLEQVTKAANEREVRIYPVQASGIDPSRRSRADDALTMMAGETGGQVVERTNRLALVFDRISEDVACSYRVGFHFRPRYSGSAQRIDVRVSGPARAYRLRYRRTVDDPTRETMESDLLIAAMFDPSSARDFPVSVRAVPLYSDGAASHVRIEVSVSIADLLALPKSGSPAGTRRLLVQLGGRIVPQLERAGEAMPSQERGAWADVDTTLESLPFGGQAEISIPPGSPGRVEVVTTLVRVAEVSAPPGRYRVVAVVEDRQTRTVGAGLADFRAGAEPAALGSVGLVLEDSRSVLVRGGPEEVAKRETRGADKRVAFVESELPANVVLAPDGTLEEGHDAEIFYSVCGIAPGEGMLERRIACGGSSDPGTMPARPAPALRAGRRCALIVEKIPAGSLSAGDECELTVVLVSQGRATESRTLALHVRPDG